MALLAKRLNRLGIKLDRLAADANGRLDSGFAEDPHKSPDAGFSPVLGPRYSQTVLRPRLESRGHRRVGRRLPFGPRLEHDGHENRDLRIVRPESAIDPHFTPFSPPGHTEREVAEQAQSIERKRFKEPTDLLLWAREAASRATLLLSAREASPRTVISAEQSLPPEASLKIDAIAPSGNALSPAADRPLLKPKLSSRTSAASFPLPSVAPQGEG